MSGNSGCFDQLAFYGNPAIGSTPHSTKDVPFASCNFDQVQFDSSQVRHYRNGTGWTSWTDHMNDPVRCDFSVVANSITKMEVKVCRSAGSGSRVPMYIRLKNDDGDECKTMGLAVGQRGHLLEFSSASLGSCKNFRVTETTQAWLSNDGKDDLCIVDMYLDTARRDGTTKVLRCRYDSDAHLKYRYQGLR